MTQYDAGPGDWSDRPWEDPEKKPKPQARRPRVTLPPWALLAILVGIVVLLCVGLVLLVRAIRGDDNEEVPTLTPEATLAAPTTEPQPTLAATPAVTPTDTVVLPIDTPQATTAPTEIGPGAAVVVAGTQGAGLNLRAEPGTAARVVANVREGTVLTVIEGPTEGDGYTWWKLRTPDNKEGWGAANWLAIKTE